MKIILFSSQAFSPEFDNFVPNPGAMQTPPIKSRIESIDLLRGLVMIIMALDHVREFWSFTPFRPEDVTQTSTPLFFTRWFTHLCAPTFVFLSGLSIYLVEKRSKDKSYVSGFILKRGLWLLVAEIFLISFFFQFSYSMIILEVIWVIGWSMILMTALIWLPKWAVGVFAIIVIAGHNMLPNIQPVTAQNFLLAMLHNSPAALVTEGMPLVIISYTIFPWVGVMAAGYVLAGWLFLNKREQTSRWLIAGLSLLLVFAVLRLINGYGEPIPWTEQPRGSWYTFLSFLNVTKYPPSLDFLCLTLGVACLFLSLFTFYRPPAASFIKTFGQVPFFFFLIHIPLILLGAYIWSYLQYGTIVNFAFQPPDQWPADYEPSLVRTYAVWIFYVVALYFPCRWYSKYKSTHHQAWLSYI